MDLDKLPHFSSAGGAAPDAAAGNLRRSSGPHASAGGAPNELSRLSAPGRAKKESAGNWRLEFPHSDLGPVPSYVEEMQDVQSMFRRQIKA